MTFEMWLQHRLVANGASIAIDGDWGRNSIKALRDFQAAKGLPLTGVADEPTVKALRGTASKTPESKMPPWMAEMHRRMGLHEVRDNKSLISFLKIGRYLGNPKNLPWCGDAIESAIAKVLPSEPLPSNPFWAQAWRDFGIATGNPVVGSIGVIRWSSSSGHVGIVAGAEGNKIHLLGGNQSNAINITAFAKDKFIAFRWPSTYPWKTYPPLKGSGLAGDFANTR